MGRDRNRDSYTDRGRLRTVPALLATLLAGAILGTTGLLSGCGGGGGGGGRGAHSTYTDSTYAIETSTPEPDETPTPEPTPDPTPSPDTDPDGCCDWCDFSCTD